MRILERSVYLGPNTYALFRVKRGKQKARYASPVRGATYQPDKPYCC